MILMIWAHPAELEVRAGQHEGVARTFHADLAQQQLLLPLLQLGHLPSSTCLTGLCNRLVVLVQQALQHSLNATFERTGQIWYMALEYGLLTN